MHKIAFSGISGSGRSSVLAEVKKLLALKYRVEEVPDLQERSPFDFDQKAGFTSQFYFISSQINEENIRAQGRPDFLLCDGSLLDHWLAWRLYRSGKQDNGADAQKEALLAGLYRFWMPSYAVVFRIRADIEALQQRIANVGLQEFDPEFVRQAEEMCGSLIQQDGLSVFEIWNQQSIDESAQEAMGHLLDMKLI